MEGGYNIVLAEASITNYHSLGGLDNKHLLPTVLGAGKFKIMVPDNLVSLSGL